MRSFRECVWGFGRDGESMAGQSHGCANVEFQTPHTWREGGLLRLVWCPFPAKLAHRPIAEAQLCRMSECWRKSYTLVTDPSLGRDLRARERAGR